MIEIKNASFSYGRMPVIREIGTGFARGELCAIVGPNGCGKTTLLRMIGNLLKPDDGRIFLDGKPYEEYGRKDFARHVASMPQIRPIPQMTVEELITNGRYPHLKFSRKLSENDENAVRTAMRLADVERFASQYLNELSGGERQRAYMALLMAQETNYVLLDEPTTYLDISAQFSVMHILRQMRDSGKCVIAVLHDLSMAMEFCDWIMVMHAGTVAADGSVDELASSDIWERVFGVRCIAAAVEDAFKYIFQPIR